MTDPDEQQPRRSATWWSAQALRLHATLLVGLAGCAIASYVEWGRALDGHDVSWVYAFEWPLFAALGGWVWWKLLHAESARRPSGPGHARAPRPATTVKSGAADPAPDDPQLLAWQDYLARLHAVDPPGGPPS